MLVLPLNVNVYGTRKYFIVFFLFVFVYCLFAVVVVLLLLCFCFFVFLFVCLLFFLAVGGIFSAIFTVVSHI